MDAHTTQFRPNPLVRDAFIKWIETKDRRHATAWAHRYNVDPEAAMCEASFWAVLTDCGVTVEPNADLTGSRQTPDFVCWSGDQKFFVEVTCIHIETATKHTGLTHLPADGVVWYRPLNDLIFGKATSKTTQCADLDAPCLLGVGTFHFSASGSCVRKVFGEWLLTGETNISWNLETRSGRAVGGVYEQTNFKSATFVRPSKLVGIEPARKPISALVVAGFGCSSPPIIGALHPNPDREFDASFLSRIPFCQLKVDFERGIVSTVWIQESEDSEQAAN